MGGRLSLTLHAAVRDAETREAADGRTESPTRPVRGSVASRDRAPHTAPALSKGDTAWAPRLPTR